LIKEDFKKHMKKAIQLLNEDKDDIHAKAKEIANQIHDKMPIIYCDAAIEGVAIRFRQQLNENSKILCWHHVVPEMNHNELVGWKNSHPKMTTIFLRNENDFDRNQARMEFSKSVAKFYDANVIEIYSKGKSAIERSLYLIHLTDWVSFYVSELRGVDPVEIEVILKLKNQLASMPLN
jgi:glucose/mannose-6-phosphate isomerase